MSHPDDPRDPSDPREPADPAAQSAEPAEPAPVPDGAAPTAPADPAAGDPAAPGDAPDPGAPAAGAGRGFGAQLRAVPGLVWAVVGALLLVCTGIGYLVGVQAAGPAGGEDGVNYAAATPGRGQAAPVAEEDGSFDATIHGPRGGEPITGPEDIDRIHRRDPRDPFALGAMDAPVVVSVFSDFECPFCAVFANETEPRIIETYVERGLVRLEWNDLALQGEKSEAAAQAGRAAAAQGRFAEFQAEIFDAAAERGRGHPEFEESDLVRIAEAAGVGDLDAFRRDLEEGVYAEPVREASRWGASLGMSATPTIVVGDRVISGAQPWEVFRFAIETALLKARMAGEGR
ncbi:DsbA family protein [Corynebacterium sphenisci]|uniref:DsbA family protein n=1 Tax=Corynebacterium sphenisci TaxID=191493 RepID=UPI0026DF130F|nr:thioredoxin domain-containing protein [Corynebacterium sphenisci]MDO5730874.1 thioredoxin domain-containing protein [Corynebacterium sphenisci]